MASVPYVRFFWSDWIADTSHLDLMQLGAYMRLLEHVYQHGRPLPGDIQRVFRICHATSATEQETIRDILAEYFLPFEDPEHGPQWRHLRAEREIEWSQKAHASRVNKALVAAGARWSKANDAPSNAPSIIQASSKQCLSNANQNQNQNQNQKGDISPPPPLSDTTPKARKPKQATADDIIPAGVDPESWRDFCQHRREIRKPLTDLAASKCAQVLRALRPQQQREAVNNSIANRWTGIFPPAGGNNGRGRHESNTVTPDEYREMIRRGEA